MLSRPVDTQTQLNQKNKNLGNFHFCRQPMDPVLKMYANILLDMHRYFRALKLDILQLLLLSTDGDSQIMDFLEQITDLVRMHMQALKEPLVVLDVVCKQHTASVHTDFVSAVVNTFLASGSLLFFKVYFFCFALLCRSLKATGLLLLYFTF